MTPQPYSRYAVYYAPEPGALADFAASWLGWDPQTAQDRARPNIAGLPRPIPELTAEPHKYGFHGTLKPPFPLAAGYGADDLMAAVDACASVQPRVIMPGLHLHQIGGFLALTPTGDPAPLAALASAVVKNLDPLRAPLSAHDRARRKPERLTPHQVALLDQYGYPYVMDEFRFHLTLTGKLTEDEATQVKATLAPLLTPLLPQPFVINELVVFGEASDGRFHILHRAELLKPDHMSE